MPRAPSSRRSRLAPCASSGLARCAAIAIWIGVALAAAAVAPAPALAAQRAPDRAPGFFDARPTAPHPLLRRNAFLTPPSDRSARAVALDYLRGHARALRLAPGRLDDLRVVRDQRFTLGLRRLEFAETAHGIPAFDTSVRATLDERGRLVAVAGSPGPDLSGAPAPDPQLDGAEAESRARTLAGGRGTPRGQPHLTWFGDGRPCASSGLARCAASPRLAWRVLIAADSRHMYDLVLDARDGSLLLRRNLVKAATGLAWDNYPGAPQGGTPQLRDFSTPGWLPPGADELAGWNAWVYADPNDDLYLAEEGDPPTAPDNDIVQIRPSGGNWNFPQTTFDLDGSGRSCPQPNDQLGACSWDFFDSPSYTANRRQAGTQLFYFVNRYHDHLRDAPGIGFTAAAGAFEGGDRLHAQVMDGVSGPAFPDADHVDNGNMLALPDGRSPRLQTYLFTSPYDIPDGVDTGINDVNGADDAGLVYHEYTHGMNNRLLCCDAGGYSLIGGPQSGAMDEAWADWYALDYLDETNLMQDTPAAGEMRFGDYENYNVRFQPTDCPAGGGAGACPGSMPADCGGAIPGLPGAGAGGFTYGDFGRICQVDDVHNDTGAAGADGVPDGEVHSDGEIWGETLWDLRSAMVAAHGRNDGIYRARALVTGGLVLSPGFPDFLDMRDSILAANTALGFGPADCERIWSVFAGRGMGSDARTTGNADTRPVEGFADPGPGACEPAPAPAAAVVAPAGPARPSLRGARARIRVSRRGTFAYPIRAAAGLRASVGFRTRAGTLLARRTFTVRRSGRAVVHVKLSRRALRTLKRRGKLVVRVTVSVRNAANLSASAGRTLTLLAPRRKPSHARVKVR